MGNSHHSRYWLSEAVRDLVRFYRRQFGGLHVREMSSTFRIGISPISLGNRKRPRETLYHRGNDLSLGAPFWVALCSTVRCLGEIAHQTYPQNIVSYNRRFPIFAPMFAI